MSVRIAPGLTLSLDLVTEATAILAKRGAGKSNTAKVVVEGLLDADAQVVVLDPVGHWWGLRSLFPVPVVGGMMGDLPLEPHAGGLLAEVVVESGQSMVLDVSQLDSDGAMQRFVYEFAEQLYKLKQAAPTPLLVVLEEADEFAPQDTRGANVPRMVGAITRIVKRGRGRGLGMLAITQRSAALSKNVLDQSDTLIVMRTTGPRDRKAIEDWVKHQDAQGMSDVIPSLPGLATGEAWFWSPQRDLLKRVKVRKARSLDTSASPELGKVTATAKLKPVDLDALGRRMAETAEKVRQNDPAELRKRIRDLERELASGEVAKEEVRVEVPVEVPVLDAETLAGLDAVFRTVVGHQREVVAAYEILAKVLSPLAAKLDDVGRGRRPGPLGPTEQGPTGPSERRRRAPLEEGAAGAAGGRLPPPAPPAPSSNGSAGVSASGQKVLDALAWYRAFNIYSPTKTQVGFVAGYKAAGGRFGNLLGELRRDGLIEYPRPGELELTTAGAEHARDPGLPHTREALHEAVLGQLPASEARVMRIILDADGGALSREEVAERSGYEMRGGRFGNILGRLSSLGLTHYPRQGFVAAREVLYP